MCIRCKIWKGPVNLDFIPVLLYIIMIFKCFYFLDRYKKRENNLAIIINVIKITNICSNTTHGSPITSKV